MKQSPLPQPEAKQRSLDPEDWDSFRSVAHQMVDRMIDQFQSLDSRPVWTPPPSNLIEKWKAETTPQDGIGEQAAFDLFCQEILPYGNGSWHPRFLGWVQGTGIPLGMMADMLASGLNSHLAGFHTAPKWIELQVIRWVTEWMGYPPDTSGLLTSGGSVANVLALHVARFRSIQRCKEDRPFDPAQPPRKLRLYASDQVHGWIWKAIDLLGLDRDSMCTVPSIDGQLVLASLKESIEKDRKDGWEPWCLVASVGTVHTGAIDDLDACAVLCEEEKLWFHIDGAFGALARLVPEFQLQLSAINQADSLAIDLHKWMYLPFEIGCVLIRDPELHRAAFANRQVYMEETDRGLLAGGVPLADRGVELTRSFRALKAWMCLHAYGIQRFSDCIERNIEQARSLAAAVESEPELELVAKVHLNIVCFRYHPKKGSDLAEFDNRSLDALNQEILLRLQESGIAVLSSTRIGDRFALRASFTNHRTQDSDIRLIVQTILQIARDPNLLQRV